MRIFPRLIPLFALLPTLGLGQELIVSQWKQAVESRHRFEAAHPTVGLQFEGKGLGGVSAWLDSLQGPIWVSDSGSRGWNLEAQALALDPVRPRQADSLIRELIHRWNSSPGWFFEASLTARRAGSPRLADSLRIAMLRQLLVQGYQRSTGPATIALWEAVNSMKAEKHDVAKNALALAAELDPLNPWVPWMRLRIAFDEKGVFGVDLGDVWESILESASMLRFYDNQLTVLYNFLHAMRLGLMIFGFLFLLVLLGHHFPRLSHALAERLPQTVSIRARYMAIAVAVLSLWVAGAGFAALALLVIPWLWPHVNWGEKVILKWLLAGLVLLPISLLTERSLLRPLDPIDGLNAYHRAYANGFDQDITEAIEKGKTGEESDASYRTLALSLQFKKQGNYRRALELLATLPSDVKSNPLAQIQKANLSFLGFDYPLAEKILMEAEKTASNHVELWFTHSQAALFQNNSAGHKQYLEKAGNHDAAFLTGYLETNDALFKKIPPNRLVMDPLPRVSEVYGQLFHDVLKFKFLMENVPGGIAGFPGWVWWAVCALSLFAVYVRSKQSLTTAGKSLFECKICGKIMCRICRKGVHCESCFKTVAGVSEVKMRHQLVERLQSRARALNRVLFRALNTLCPGAGWLFLGHTGFRVLWMLCVALALGWTFQMHHLVSEYPVFSAGLLIAWPYLILAGLYLGALFVTLIPRKGAKLQKAADEGGIL